MNTDEPKGDFPATVPPLRPGPSQRPGRISSPDRAYRLFERGYFLPVAQFNFHLIRRGLDTRAFSI